MCNMIVSVLYCSYMFRLPHSGFYQTAEKKNKEEIIYS